MAARDRTTTAIIAALAVVAASLTLYQLSRPGLLFGVTPDVSVYVGGAVRLVHGAVPYRDFVFIQPPGFVLLSTPVAFLSEVTGTRDALALLRLCTPLLAAANVVLAGRLVRHHGRAATAAACAVMATFPAELYAIRGPQLEPFMVLFCLGGAALVFDGPGLARPRRVALGGVLLGFAVAIKAPAVLPLVVLAAVCAPRVRRALLPLFAGAVTGGVVPTLPFLVMAPGAFVRDVVSSVFARIPAAGRVPWQVRLGDMTGASVFGTATGLAVAICVALGAFVAVAFADRRRGVTPLEWFAVGSVVVVGMAQLVPALYFTQYAAFLMPFVALLAGVSVGRLAVRRAALPALVAGAAAVAVLTGALVSDMSSATVPDVAVAVDAVVPAGGCALSDSPVFLFTSDRFASTVRGCTVMTDPYGTTLALGNSSPDAVAAWGAAFHDVDYVVTTTAIDDWVLPAAAHIGDYVARNFHLRRSGLLLVYVRNSDRP